MEYYERTDKKLDQVLDAVSALSLQLKELPTKSAGGLDAEPAPITVAPPTKLVLTNPPLTKGMEALFKNVVKNRAQRAEDKKKAESTQEENSKKVSATSQ